MDERIAETEKRIMTRSSSAATGIAPGHQLEQQKRSSRRNPPGDDIVEENNTEDTTSEHRKKRTQERGSSDTERDGSWKPPGGKGKAVGSKEDSSDEENLDGDEIAELADGDVTVIIQSRIEELYAQGRMKEGAALLAQFMETYTNTSPRNSPAIDGNRNATPGPSNHPNRRRTTPPANPPANRHPTPEPQQQRDDRIQTPRNGEHHVHRDQARGDVAQTQRRSPAPYRLIQEDLSETSSMTGQLPPPEAGQRTQRRDQQGTDHVLQPCQTDLPRVTPTESEEELAKAMLESGKGRMVLANGDVIENGRLILMDESVQMEKGLTQLSPTLQVYLRTFKAYIPLSVFEKIFLIQDHQAWSTKKGLSEAKILEGGAGVKVYSGEPPIDELTMQYEQWLDAISLFIKYVRQEGWHTQAKRFEKHRQLVIGLREDIGWMVALRYCRRVRQGVMRSTIDKKICNISKLQTAILDEGKMTCENFNERAYQTNPYAPGGPKDHIDPETGLAKAASKKAATTSSTHPKKEGWLPEPEYRAKKAAERAKREAEAKLRRENNANKYAEDRGRTGGYDQNRYNRGRSRSRSRDRYQNTRYGNKNKYQRRSE